MSEPYRATPVEVRVEKLEAQIGELRSATESVEKRFQKAIRGTSFGEWLFRTATLIVGAFVLFCIAMAIRQCANAPPSKHRTSAAQRQRAEDERTCRGISGAYVQRLDGDLVCSRNGGHDLVTFHRHSAHCAHPESEGVEVIRTKSE